jgi:hypothetical protein
LQQHHPLKLDEILTDSRDLASKAALAAADLVHHFVVSDGSGRLQFCSERQINLLFVAQHFFKSRDVPLFFDTFNRNILACQVSETTFPQGGNLAGQAVRIHDVVALLVDHCLPPSTSSYSSNQLLHTARLNLTLRRLERDDAGFNRFTVGILTFHDGFDAVSSKDAHQRIVQTQIKARRARVALAAGAATQLVVDAAWIVTPGCNDAQTTQGKHLFVLNLPLPQTSDLSCLAEASIDSSDSTASTSALNVAAQHDVRPATGHALVAIVTFGARPVPRCRLPVTALRT